ncbi:MAG: hypothetical protein AB7U74_07665 [Afipia sp.]
MLQIPNALASVERTGLELVKKRKPRGRIATMRDYAKISFEPWTRGPEMKPGELIPSNEALLNCAIPSRMAYAVMLRTKKQLVDMFDEIDLEHIDNMMASIADAAERLKSIVCMLEAADMRLLVAASANQIAKGKAQGLAKRRRTFAKQSRR